MASYILGDIQGCFDELQALLDKVQFNPQNDTLYVAGDLVARGPKSLETLRFLFNLGDSAACVLGNHDLHLLAVSLGIHKVNPKDKTQAIFEAEDKDELLTWLRHQPMMIEGNDFVICHAGISPQWDLNTARKQAHAIEKKLRHPEKWQILVKEMYGDSPTAWQPDLPKLERLRFSINSFTRMRFCHQDGSLEMSCKLPPSDVTDPNLYPWFQVPSRQPLGKTVIFGHWAALMGCHDQSANVIGLDTGCVWGEHLTMLRWDDMTFFTQEALS
ncbi:MAG: symmetrical bis(5'-nucleosyl)-tetraphosphatase [Vibrio sp.]